MLFTNFKVVVFDFFHRFPILFIRMFCGTSQQ